MIDLKYPEFDVDFGDLVAVKRMEDEHGDTAMFKVYYSSKENKYSLVKVPEDLSSPSEIFGIGPTLSSLKLALADEDKRVRTIAPLAMRSVWFSRAQLKKHYEESKE